MIIEPANVSAWLSLCYDWAFAIHLDSGTRVLGMALRSHQVLAAEIVREDFSIRPSCSSRLLAIKGQVDLSSRLLEVVGRNAGKRVA
jgi:hypothetical protein